MFEFDYFTGGGFPKGRYTIVYGPESSGKTNLALKAVVAAQHLPPPCNKVFWNNTETFDKLWAAKMGVDIEKLILINPGYGEEAVDLTDAFMRATDVALGVVDSLAAIVPSKEIAKSVEGADMMTAALLIKRMVNKMQYAFSDSSKINHFPAMILINQTRFKPTQFGDPEVMPGGDAQKFLASLRIRLYGKNVTVKEIHPNLTAFKDISAIIKKSKVPVLGTNFKYKQCMLAHGGLAIGDTDSWGLVSTELKSLNILEKTPKGYAVLGDNYKTLGDIADRYRSDFQYSLTLQGCLINAAQDQGIFVDEPQPDVPILEGKPVPFVNQDESYDPSMSP